MTLVSLKAKKKRNPPAHLREYVGYSDESDSESESDAGDLVVGPDDAESSDDASLAPADAPPPPAPRNAAPQPARPAQGKGLTWGQHYAPPVVQPWDGVDDKTARLSLPARTRAATRSGSEWLDFFVCRNMKSLLLERTNSYAQVLAARERPPWSVEGEGKRRRPWPPAWTENFTPVTENELDCFLGISLFMGVVHFPRVKQYWKQSWPFQGLLRNVMSRDRYLEIHRALNFALAGSARREHVPLVENSRVS